MPQTPLSVCHLLDLLSCCAGRDVMHDDYGTYKVYRNLKVAHEHCCTILPYFLHGITLN